jgi:hypothetical protein
MTHDELLEELDEVIKDFDKKYDNSNPYYKALRAVVELHKPESSRMPFCVECRGVWQGEIDVVLYPCPTIQAIEKELQ